MADARGCVEELARAFACSLTLPERAADGAVDGRSAVPPDACDALVRELRACLEKAHAPAAATR